MTIQQIFGLNVVFRHIFTGVLRNSPPMYEIRTVTVLLNFLSSLRATPYGAIPIIVMKLSGFKDDDVRNFQKIEYFYDFLDFRQRRKYNLSSDRRFLKPETRELYLYNFSSIFYF